MQNDDLHGRTVVVKETDVKVEMTSDDNKTTQVKQETRTIQKVEYDTRGTPAIASVSVSKDVRPVGMQLEGTPPKAVETPKEVDSNQNKENSSKTEPMALFGALRYLKEQEQAAPGSAAKAEPSRPISDIFSNIYKNNDNNDNSENKPTPSPAPASTTTTTTASRPISDVFANIYKPTQTTTVMSELERKGDVEIQRVQHVTVTHDVRVVPSRDPPAPSPPVPSVVTVTPPAPTCTQVNGHAETVTITQNGEMSPKPVVNGVSDVSKTENAGLAPHDDDSK